MTAYPSPEVTKTFDERWIKMMAPWPFTIRDRRITTGNETKDEEEKGE